MKYFLSGVLALVLTAALSSPARAGASAQIIRAFVYDGTLYTYMSIDGTEKPVTKAEVKIGSHTFAASGRLETVRQAGSPVTCLLLVDNSNSMPAFRQEAEDFAESLAQSGGENSRFILAAFGDTFAITGEDVPAEELAEAVKSLPLDENVTRLHTAIDQAIDYFESVPREGNELRCLVVLSDGVQYDPNGGIPYEELLEKVEQSDVMLHSVGLGDDTQALESLGKLAGASGGLHQVLDEALSPQSAGAALADASGNLFVTGFDLSGGAFSGGTGKAAVTLASGGELLCRAETEVELPEQEETAESAPDRSLPDAGHTASGVQPEEAATAAESSRSAAAVWIIPAAALGAALFILILAVLLRRRRRRRKTVPASVEESALTGIYMRLEPLRGDLAAGQGTDLELREELLIGSSPACGIVFASGGIEPQHARVLLSGGTVCLEDLGGGTLVNGIPVTAPAALRSGDEISVGEAAFRLKF